ncbi:MAG: Gfo/Idh/MocA family oxidoreductase [Saprospiraceae bacterium]|nr:Gfo/Idh/MocA family oxidoreductase [Saprospiraceae bacterium]
MSHLPQSRRAFLKHSALYSGAVVLAPQTKRISASSKLNLAFIGAGGRAGRNIKACDIMNASGAPTNNVVALCDVNEQRAAEAFKRYPKARRFADFRRMFDAMADQIDAVVISTPDHTHFSATMAAMQLGKHVYVEKPLAHNIWELRTLKKAAAYYDVVTQMGNQGHTTNGIRLIKEWYEAGILGEVKEIIGWIAGPNFSETGYFLAPEEFPPETKEVPRHLNWDLWLGPREDRPYTRYYEPRFWRGWFDFGNGLLGDWACHTLDAPFWSLNLGMPSHVQCISKGGGSRDFLPNQSHIRYTFPEADGRPSVSLEWFEGGLKPPVRPEWGIKELPRSGMIMVGSKCSLMTGGRPNKPILLIGEEAWNSFVADPPAQTMARVAEEDPQGEWIRAIKGDGPMCLATFDYGADLTEMALLGVLAQRTHSNIEYDAVRMQVTNQDGLQELIKEPMRAGWSYGEDLW